MPININDVPQTSVSDRYKTQYDKQFETLPKMSLSVPRSKYDEGYIYNQLNPEASLEEQRAQRQPWTTKVALGLPKAGVLAGATAVDGILGTIVGLGNMAAEGKGSAFWNNPVSNWTNDLINKADEWMPIYATKASKNSSFVGQMAYPDFWGDKFLKNLGFTGGMILDGMLTGGASMELMGAKSLAAKLPKAIANAALKGEKALAMAYQEGKGIELTSEIINNAKQLDRINRISQAAGTVLSTQGEARFEAINNSTQFYDDNKKKLDDQLYQGLLSNDEYNKKLDLLKKAQEGYGNADFLANIVILGVSNSLQFKNLFTKGFNPSKAIAEGITGSIVEGYTYRTPIIKQSAKIAKNILAEGVWEEQGQYFAQQASDDFYQKKFNGKKQDKLDDIFHALYKGLSDAYGTRAGWDQGLIGSLTGALGMPMLSRNQKTGRVGLDWAGGIWGDVGEVKEENEFNHEAVKHLNETLQSNDFKNNYESTIRNLTLDDEKNIHALAGDKYEVLNKQHEQFINDALQFIKAGKYEDFIDHIKNIKNSNAEEVRQLFATKPITLEDQTREFYGLKPEPTEGQKKAKDIFGDYTSDQIVEKLNRNANSMLASAKTIKDLHDAYTTQYPEMHEDVKETLIYTASRLEDINKRINDINNESISKFGLDINNYIKIKDNKVDLNDYIKEYKKVVDNKLLDGKFNPTDVVNFTDKIKDLSRLLPSKIEFTDFYKKITTGKGIEELENNFKAEREKQKDIKKEEKTYIPSSGDNIIYKDKRHTIDSVNDDGTYNIVDEEGNITNSVPKEEVTLNPKKSHLEPQDATEPLNNSDVPPSERSLLTMREKGLKDVATSMSTSNWDINQQKTIVRNEEHDDYISNNENDLKGDKVKFNIDKNSDFLKSAGLSKSILDKVISGTPLTKEEANDALSHIKKVSGEDRFESPVDRIPIKLTHTSSSGEVYEDGLYYHESGYDNINIPLSVLKQGDRAIKDYIKAQKERTRENRRIILSALLTGNEVTIGISGKSKGIPNNTNTNRRIDEVLNIPYNQIKLGLALGSGSLWTGHSSAPIEGGGTPGSVFFETDKTCNGEKVHLKANVSKISAEHAGILWNSILTLYHKGNGYNTIYNGTEVEGLTVGEVINLLTYMGQRTNLDHPDNQSKLGEHLRSKQLFIDDKLVLHYGINQVALKGGIYSKNSELNYDEEKAKFIEWAVNNKNYAINKELPKMGIELNKVMKKKFKLGTDWISDGKDTYSGFLIKNGVVQTDVQEYKNTGSLFHAPVVFLDLTSSGLKFDKPAKVVEEGKKTVKTNEKNTTKKSNNPKNTGNKTVEVGEQVSAEGMDIETLRSLPLGTNIHYLTVTRGSDPNEPAEVISKPVINIVDRNGKKFFNIQATVWSHFFTNEEQIGLEKIGKPMAELEVSDKSLQSLSKMINKLKDKVKIDTDKSVEGAKQKTKAPKKPKVEKEPEGFSKFTFAYDEKIGNQQIEELSKEQPVDLTKPIEEPEVTIPKETEVEAPQIDIENWTDGSEVEWGEEPPAKIAYAQPDTYKVIDINKEVAWLHNKLGKDIPIEIRNGLIDLARTSKKAFGILRDNTIVLSRLAEKGTSYHEAFHKVSLLYLDNEQRESIYKEARNRYSKNLVNANDRQVEEYLAERFRDYVISRESTSPKELTIFGKIGKFFSDIYHMVKNIFTGSKRLTELDIDKLFQSIQSGRFLRYKPLEENLKKLEGKESPLEIHGVKLEGITNTRQLKSITRGLASIATKKVAERIFAKDEKTKYGNINITDAIQDIDLDGIKDKVKTNLDAYNTAASKTGTALTLLEKGTLGEEQIKFLNNLYGTKSKTELSKVLNDKFLDNSQKSNLWQEVYDHYEDIFRERVSDYIDNELGIKRYDEDSDDIASRELVRYDKASYEYSLKENVTNSVKFALSNIRTSEEVNSYTGLHEYVTMDEIWSRLMADLHHLDTIEDMLQVIENKSSYYPYKELAKKLKEKGSELLLTQFETSFRKHRHAFLNAMLNVEGNNFKFYFTDADIHKAANQSIRAWGEMFSMSSLIEDGKVNTKSLQNIFNEYKDLKEYYSYEKDKSNIQPYKNKLVNILNKLHIEVDDKTIDRLIENTKKAKNIGTDYLAFDNILKEDFGNFFSDNSTLYKYAHAKETSSLVKLELKSLFQNEKVIRDLSTAFVETNPQDTSDMVPGANGDPHYVYSDPTYVTDVIRELTKDDREFLQNLLKAPFERGSYILNQLQDKSIRDQFGVNTFNAFIKDKSGDDGRGYLDISPIEDFLFKLNAFDKGYIPMPTLADRKTYPILKGINLPNFRYIVNADGKEVIDPEIIDIFYNYALAEKNRIDQAWDTLRKYSEVDQTGKLDKDGGPKILKVNDWSKLVENYHYVTDNKTKNKDKGLGYEYQLFSSFNREGFDFNRDARNEIEKILERHIKYTSDFSDRLGITDNGINTLLDSEIVDKVAKEYGGNKQLAVKHILADFTTKSMISSIESMMLFSGDLAFYKDTEDYVKRLGVLTSSGALLRLDIPGEFTNSEYTTSTLTRSRFDSTYYDLLYNKQKDLLQEKYSDKDKEFINKLLDERLKNYTDRKLDPTDAQVYISPEMYREISIRRGQWGDTEEDAFRLLNSTDPITSEQEQILLNVVLNPLKYVYFDRLGLDTSDINRLNIPTYDKMSLATLFRRYVVGTYMEDVLDRMEAKGKYGPTKENPGGLPKIHMFKYDSAVKVGNRSRIEQFKNVNTDNQEANDLSTIDTYQQNFRFLRHQVVTDPHEKQSTLLGTQAKKIGLSNIIDDGDYNIDGKTIKGKEIKNNINKALSRLSNVGLDRLLDKLGVDNNDNIDEDKFRDLLYKEGKKAGLSENVLEGIRIGLSMDSMPERKWVYNRIISMINKETIDTYLPGNQLIQMSGYGLGMKDTKSIYDKTNDLRFIFNDKGEVKGLEAKVSVNVFNNILPSELDTYEKKVEWLNEHKELLQGLGYRIPTQGQNSMVPINVVEFLPEQIGDVVILPNEFTALTGSDFDIDKLFFVRYNYETNKEGEIVKTKSDLEGNEKSIQNYLLDHYRSILLSDHHFLSTSSPLGNITDRLKKLSSTIVKHEGEKMPLLFASPVYQAEVKYKYSGGKFGIGPEALNNVHHIMSQVANLSFNYNIGIGLVENGITSLHGLYGLPEANGEEVLISDWLSALIDSHVDIAKDPYIINLNVVKRTYNVVNLLVRIGMGMKTFEFTSQPILKDLVSESINQEGDVKSYNKDKPASIVYNEYQNKLGKDAGDVNNQLQDYKLFEDNLLKLAQTKKEDRDALWYGKQLRILEEFQRLDEGPGKELNDLVMASRVDTKKWGKNLIEARLYDKSVKKVIRDNKFVNLDKLINLDPNAEDTSFLSTYYNNSVDLVQRLFRNKTMTATDKYNDLIDHILTKTGLANTKDGGLINKISDNLHSAFASRFFSGDHTMMNLNSQQVKKIINNVNDFILNVIDTHPELKENVLIQTLSKGRTTTTNGQTFVGIPSIKSDDNFVKEDLMYAWQELLQSDKPDVAKFAKELFVYSFYTSGFNKGAYSIFHYIPANLLKEFETKEDILSYDEHMRGITEGLLENGLSYIDELSNKVVDEVFKNNWYNPKYVPPVQGYSSVINVSTKSDEPAVIKANDSRYLLLGPNKNGDLVYKPYVLINVKGKDYLMEYIGYVPNDMNKPVYMLTNKMGMYEKGRRMVEYGLNESTIEDNKISSISEEKVLVAIEKEKSYDSFIYIEPNDRIVRSSDQQDVSNQAFTDSPLKDNTLSSIDISTTDRSLNVGAENRQVKYNYELEKQSLRDDISNSGYSDEEEVELNKTIDETEVNTPEDLNKLIDKLCGYGTGKFSIRGKKR